MRGPAALVAPLRTGGAGDPSARSSGNGSAIVGVGVGVGDGAARPTSAAAVQRAIDLANPPTVAVAVVPTPPAANNSEQTVRRFVTSGGADQDPDPFLPASGPNSAPTDHGTTTATNPPSTTAVLDRVDEMMAQLEERILEELERRGGRFTGSF